MQDSGFKLYFVIQRLIFEPRIPQKIDWGNTVHGILLYFHNHSIITFDMMNPTGSDKGFLGVKRRFLLWLK